MSITLQHERDNVYRLELRGLLQKAEFDRCQVTLAGEIDRVGPVRLLVVLDGFTGWEREDGWGDVSFFLEHGGRIERIAIVGDERWRDESLMFAAADFRDAPVQFFAQNAEAGARLWLAGSDETARQEQKS